MATGMNRILRNVALAAAIGGCCLTASAQVDAFKRAAKLPNVEYVYLSRDILAMVGGSLPVQGMDEVASQLNSMEVLSASSPEAAQQSGEMLDSCRAGMELLTHIAERDGTVEIYGVRADEGFAELLVLVQNDSSLSAVMMKGAIDPEVIKRIAADKHSAPQNE